MTNSNAYWAVLLLFASASSWGYGVGDHTRLVRQAVREFNECFPGVISTHEEIELWSGDIDEDTDLIRKWVSFSHYYNPEKHLKMRRQSSLDRLIDLERHSIGMLELGHIIHHIQDMTAPPHVVPVNHWLTDGFERYSVQGEISSGLSCADLLASKEDPEILLNVTAEETLRVIRSTPVPGEKDNREPSSPIGVLSPNAEAFWQESSDDGFGHYGWLGNNFGHAHFKVKQTIYSVPPEFYEEFKQARMKAAVAASEKALVWLVFPGQSDPGIIK